MLRLLCPQWVFDNYEAVTPEFLKEHGAVSYTHLTLPTTPYV